MISSDFQKYMKKQDPTQSPIAGPNASPLTAFGGPPQMMSPLGPTGMLGSQYKVNLQTGGRGGLDMARSDIGYLRGFARGTGPSPLLLAQQQRLGQQYGMAREDMRSGQASNLASSMGQLGAMGGISGGARMRLAQQSNMQGALAEQRMGAEQAAGMTGLDVAEGMQRQQTAQALPQMGLAYQQGLQGYAGMQNQQELINKAAQLAAMDAENRSRMEKYGIQMQGLGAEKSAQAMSNSGGKGGGGILGMGK